MDTLTCSVASMLIVDGRSLNTVSQYLDYVTAYYVRFFSLYIHIFRLTKLLSQLNTENHVNAHTTQETNGPRCEKTGLLGFRPGMTQTGLYSHRRWLEA